MLRPASTPGKAPPAPDRTTPLWAVLAVSWISSFGTAVAWAGIFFVTDRVLGYSKAQNLTLGAVLGFTYAAAAFYALPITGVVARARRPGPSKGAAPPSPKRSARAVLALIMVVGAALALVPLLWRAEWTIWLFGLTYSPLTGLLWPGVEQYVSSGRRGADLNRAAGAFNLAWASAMLVAMWCMVPLLGNHPWWIIGALAPLHLICLAFLRHFNPEPHTHGQAAHEHDPDQDNLYRRLLRLARGALLFSYVLHASLMPIIPQLMGELGIAIAAKPALTSIWMTTRLGAFAAMQRWRAWHAKGAFIALGCVLMLIAYAGCIGAPSPVVLGLSLAFFGIGVGTIYAAAIYYALEVGTTDIDAGAKHEAMIGFGYGVGPLIALLAWSLFGVG